MPPKNNLRAELAAVHRSGGATEEEPVFDFSSIFGPLITPDTVQAEIKNAIVRTDAGLSIAGCVGNAAGLDIPDTITAEELQVLAQLLFDLDGRIQLFIGDMLAAAERLQYGFISELAERMGKDSATLMNWKSACLNVKLSLRREVLTSFPEFPLTMGHYRLITKFEETVQRQWLMYAAAEKLSVADMRKAMKGKDDPPLSTLNKLLGQLGQLSKSMQVVKTLPLDQRQELAASLRRLAEEIEG